MSPVRVVIYGRHSEDWMAALAVDAPVWTRIDEIAEVIAVAADPAVALLEPASSRTRTVIIPLMEVDAKTCPRQYSSLFPDRRALTMLGNKAAFRNFVDDHGLAAWHPTSYDTVAEVVYPCVLKRVDLNAGEGVAVVDSASHLWSLLEDKLWRYQDFILQSFVPGPDYVSHFVCQDGRVLWHHAFEYEIDAADRIRRPNNVTSRRPFAPSAEILAKIGEFLTPLRYSGPCNVDYKRGRDGSPIVLEINPRLGGSLMKPDSIDALRDALACIVRNAR